MHVACIYLQITSAMVQQDLGDAASAGCIDGVLHREDLPLQMVVLTDTWKELTLAADSAESWHVQRLGKHMSILFNI